MKASNKRILVTVISFLFVLLLAVMPMTAFAEEATFDKIEMDGTTATNGAYVYAKGVDISPFDGNFSEETVYSMTVSHSRTTISSFQMSFRMPYFVDVTNVYASDALLNNAETAAFEWHMDEKNYVNVSYSSPYNVSEVELFTVEFTLNSTATAYESVECVYSEFVDDGAKTVNAEVDLGYVSIGVAEIVVMGDVNGDKIVNLADLLIIQRSIVNKGYALTEEQLAVADINRDGEISMIDCQYIQNFLVGKLDSLENVNTATYNIDVLIKDQNGNWLYSGSFVANSGELYSNYMTPIFMSLYKQYNITGNISIESDVYGTVDPDSNGEGFVVKDKDYLVMTVEVNYGSEEEKIYVTGSDLLPNELTVPVGTSSEALIKAILSDVNIVLYLSDGSTREVALTEDMIDLSNVVLDVDGYYSVLVNYYISEFDYDATNSIQLHVTPDISKWQHLGTYTFAYDGYNAFGWETFDFYVEAVVIDGEEFCEWTSTEDGIISVSQEGVTILMQIDDENKTVSFYKPSDALIGTYTFSEGDMTMTFDVYGKYSGAGEYVTCMTQTMIGDGGTVLSAGFTSYTQLDLENGILAPSMMSLEFVINEDNSLTMKECEHEWQYTTQAPTCTNPGWENKYCTKCGSGSGCEIPALGHSYDDSGVCSNCGATNSGTDEPSLDDEFIAYRQERMAAVKSEWYNTIKKYADYDVQGEFGEQFNYLYETISTATNESVVERYSQIFYEMIDKINANYGNATDCEHANISGEEFAGDCWNDGYSRTYCTDCGMQISYEIIAPAGHVYNDSGVCERCGGSVGGEIIDDSIYMTQADFGVIGITVNDTADDLINKLVGQKFYVYYSQSGMVEMTVTADMIDVSDIPFGSEGGNEGRVTFYDNNGFEYYIHFYVIIMPDLSEVEYQTYKVVNGEAMGLYELKVYANGYVLITGDGMDNYPGSYIEAPFKENVILFDMDGGYLVFELGEGVADFYHPETELDSIKTFYMSNEYMSLEMTAYGSYTGAGDYVAVMSVTEFDSESGTQYNMSITTMLYLDMDSSVVIHVMFGERSYDEAGNMYCSHANIGIDSWEGNCWSDGYKAERCYDCGEQISYEVIPAGHQYGEDGICTRCGNSENGSSGETTDSIYLYIDKHLSVMCEEWNALCAELAISDEYNYRFNELTARIKEATTCDEVDNIFNVEFRALCDEAIANSGDSVYLNNWDLTPSTVHVQVGTSVEEFVEYFLSNHYVVLYFSDGTSTQASFTAEMLILDNLDLSSVGTTNLDIPFTYGNHSIYFSIQVYVDPDMSNANLLGTYTYAGQVYNGMEWETAEVYDNGYAILYCEGEIEDFVEYTLSDDGIFTYEMYGEKLVYMVSGDGVYCYASKDVIGSYQFYEDGEGFNIAIFGEYTGYGEYYAYLEMLEYNNDGSEDRYAASTVVILDMENAEIYCGLIGGWMVYDESGNVTPKECEHEEINDEGYCTYCGYNTNENSGSGEVVVTPSTPSVDSDYTYTEDGNSDYTYTDEVIDGNYSVAYN